MAKGRKRPNRELRKPKAAPEKKTDVSQPGRSVGGLTDRS